MVPTTLLSGVQFGRATLTAVVGGLFDQPVEAVVLGANRRGIFSLSVATALRDLGGPQIEREATTRAPLEMGSVLIIDAHGLQQRGVQAVLHAVVAPSLGQPVRRHDARRALLSVLATVEERGYRSLAIPLLGADTVDRGEMSQEAMIQEMVDLVVGRLRRGAPRLRTIVIVTRYTDQAEQVIAAAQSARERSWRQDSA